MMTDNSRKKLKILLLMGILFVACFGTWTGVSFSKVSFVRTPIIHSRCSLSAICLRLTAPISQSKLVVLLDHSGSLVEGSTLTDRNGYSISAAKALADLWLRNVAVIPIISDRTQRPIFESAALSDLMQRADVKNEAWNCLVEGHTQLSSLVQQTPISGNSLLMARYNQGASLQDADYPLQAKQSIQSVDVQGDIGGASVPWMGKNYNVAGVDGTIPTWDVLHKGSLLIYLSHYDVAWSPDGRMLASGSYDLHRQESILSAPFMIGISDGEPYRQESISAEYTGQDLSIEQVRLFVDSAAWYSENLAGVFSQQFLVEAYRGRVYVYKEFDDEKPKQLSEQSGDSQEGFK